MTRLIKWSKRRLKQQTSRSCLVGCAAAAGYLGGELKRGRVNLSDPPRKLDRTTHGSSSRRLILIY